MATLRRVHGAVGRAHQPLARDVKKLVWLVIHFHGHVVTTVQVGINLALITDSKRGIALAEIQHIKRNGMAAVHQVTRRAKKNGFRHAWHSGIGTQPAMQLRDVMRHINGAKGVKRFGLMRAITHANARAPGVQGHLQIMGGVTNHQRAFR